MTDRAGKRAELRRTTKKPPARPADPGPSSLLCLAWAAGTATFLFAGAVTSALWFGTIAGLAAVQAGRSWRTRQTHVLAPAAGAGAAVAVLGAAFGIPGAVVGIGAGLGGAAAWATSAGANPVLTVACAALPAAAAVPPVLLRSTNGLVPAFVLLSFAAVYDAACSVMGAGARWRWEGPVAGMLCIGSVTLGVAAIFPQFKGLSPWELGVIAAVAAPAGPIVASRILGDHAAKAQALRRLDSLIVLGPAWGIAAALLVS